MKNRNHALVALALASVLLSGCGAPSANVGPAAAVHAGAHGHGSSSPAAAVPGGPSDAALMVCGGETMGNVTSILGLTSEQHTVNDWADGTFTCTYHLGEGALEIAVKEAADPAAARTYFDAMQALAKGATPIEGLANLGFPAYETADGSAVFQKDNMILHVDASDLSETLGPDSISRTAFAYQLSTTILACWKEHP
ncbi:hypothetical protein GU243_01255 [Pseudarthrobacter psychrotolerans]|uniref:DUF3558 domain-containing protein n=1 Tax=Pseudarthrobacter psychrotolerans TaxID=2697569 RepID=A0A6P1NGY7_9MICC|nr:hypothetical protein [Pseudarthrobacter psychrotolerans]QHK18628.1 hypothetical protein GU243_01255 [Pseudarthrobacter psychrotolerans]